MPVQMSDEDFVKDEPKDTPPPVETKDAPVEGDEKIVEVELPQIDEFEDEEEDKTEEKDETDELEPKALGTLTFKEIKERFKGADGEDIFEAVPNLRRALILDQQFHSSFNSIEEAQSAAERAELFDSLEQKVMNGDPANIIQAIAKDNPKALGVFVENVLPQILEANESVFQDKIVLPIFNNLLNEVRDRAQQTRNKNLWLAVKWISSEINGTPDVPERIAIKKQKTEPNPREIELNQREIALNQRQYKDFTEVINGEIDRLLERDIDRIIEEADPNNALTKFTKRHLRDDIFTDLIDGMRQDRPHGMTMVNLFKLASRSGYSPEAKSRVKSAILARAKKDLRVIANKHLNEAVGAIRKTGKVQQFATGGGGRVQTGQRSVTKAPPSSKIDYDNNSDDEILQGRVKLK